MARRRTRRRAAPRRAPSRTRRVASAAASRTAAAAKQKKHALISVGSAALIGYAAQKKWKPPTIGKLSPELFYGLLLGFAGPMFIKGNMGKNLEAAGVGLLACAARDVGAGRDVIGYDDDALGYDSLSGGMPSAFSDADVVGAEVIDL